ncbi:hypothetical protein P171DRAFT_482938 [Karstenula rhodostoma CBS 690.94]|uniref:Uncharacterized protein n=1 Tax=Karstenula rhodostoma CBS 690.94 TaxID=1392251 RepID=A0A9P4PP89_9PLEO|nr:hypothetical protein P171DRAFT_482938 [Karstenula rhodostoma CBS 690.94]
MYDHIIEGRRQGLASKQIEIEIKISATSATSRWHALEQQNRVPEDVLDIGRRKEEVAWCEENEETILKAWKEGQDDEKVAKSVTLEGRNEGDIRERLVALRFERGPGYKRVMDMEGKRSPDALKQALSGNK